MSKFQVFVACAVIMVFAFVAVPTGSPFAQSAAPSGLDDPDARSYDAQIYRLSEIIGAVHYLRELCGADEGQRWRNEMRQLLSAEGTSALRRAKLVDSFNKGYRGYARTYRTCTRPALQAIRRFMRQGAEIADALIENNR
jgi:uncharacterized protein (TIGR02301 family)